MVFTETIRQRKQYTTPPACEFNKIIKKMLFSVKRNVENRWLPELDGKKQAKISQSPTKKFWMRIWIKNQIFNGGCAKEPPLMMRKRKMPPKLLKRKPERREGGKFHLLIEIN